MNERRLHITLDYELFFGSSSGTVDKCMIKPVDRLMALAEKHQAKFVFFVDAGHLTRLKQFQQYEACRKDHDQISAQIARLFNTGHEIALHVHPHWEDTVYEAGGWKMDTRRYKLSDFSDSEADEVISRYHETLKAITGSACHSFRAGGWCVQPFSKMKRALEQNRIFIDSSVFKNGYHQFSAQSYDFRSAPDETEWRFEDDVCKVSPGGKFLEIPATPDRISPAFYLEMYLKMRSNPADYKPLGDGSWLKDKKKVYQQFYTFTSHFASCDGYFASRLKGIMQRLERENKKRMLVLGHPKSMAECSFQYLDEFLKFASEKGYKISPLYEDPAK